ncbi:MAG: glycosyltransferase 87 family protein [Nitrospiraceae bacterium]|nr:glycosyltransferase 87 family protein [Nitrospiraceae bacterium]MDA8261346.1 glycosyltransferase 87 family protein [Actinomycetota bacterium]
MQTARAIRQPQRDSARWTRYAPWFATGLVLALVMASRDNQADFLVFYKAASALAHGHDPYPRLGSAQVYDGSSYVYPIWVAATLTPLTLLTPFAAAKVWVAISLAAYALSFKLLGKPSGSALLLAGLTTPVIISLQMGTLTPFLVLGIAVAWRWRDTPVVAAAAVALAGTSKLYLLAILVFFAATRRLKALGLSVAFSVTLLGAGFLLGPIGATGYARLLLSLSKHESVQGWSSSAILAPLVGVGTARLLPQVAAIAAAAGLLWLRRRHPSDRRALAGAVSIALLATPILWSSYLPLLLPILFLADAPIWAIWVAAALSWALTTPDRAQAPLDAAAMGLLAALAAFSLLGGSTGETLRTLRESGRSLALRARHSFRRGRTVWLAACTALAAEAAVGAFHPALLPAIVSQDLVIASIAYALTSPGELPEEFARRPKAPVIPLS